MTAGTYALTVPQTGTLSASKDITVNFTTDSEVTSTITVTGTSGSYTEPTGSGNAYSFTINAPASVTHDDSISFSVTVEDKATPKKSDTFTIDVNYSNPRPFSRKKRWMLIQFQIHLQLYIKIRHRALYPIAQ